MTTVKSFYVPVRDEFQKERFPACKFQCVGPLVDPRKDRCDKTDFPLDEVKKARNSGRAIVLVSLGTNVLTFESFPPNSVRTNDDGTTLNGKTLSGPTGKDFGQFVFRTCFEALGGRDYFLVVLAAGKGESPLEGLGIKTPNNFLVATFVPQLEVLPSCLAFVTHGGMGGVNESLILRVPMIVVPVMADQIYNADSVEQAKIGFSFRYPFKKLKTDALRSAVEEVADNSSTNPYRVALEAAATEAEKAIGGHLAATAIRSVTKHLA